MTLGYIAIGYLLLAWGNSVYYRMGYRDGIKDTVKAMESERVQAD